MQTSVVIRVSRGQSQRLRHTLPGAPRPGAACRCVQRGLCVIGLAPVQPVRGPQAYRAQDRRRLRVARQARTFPRARGVERLGHVGVRLAHPVSGACDGVQTDGRHTAGEQDAAVRVPAR